jgi:hypothetical protein
MRAWKRTPIRIACGNCCRWIARGAIYRSIRLVGVQAELRRCIECAGDGPPPDLPELIAPTMIAPTARPSRRRTFVSVDALAKDWKSKAAGE